MWDDIVAWLQVNGGRLIEYKVHFVPSVMLLEAAARNDVEEGESASLDDPSDK